MQALEATEHGQCGVHADFAEGHTQEFLQPHQPSMIPMLMQGQSLAHDHLHTSQGRPEERLVHSLPSF